MIGGSLAVLVVAAALVLNAMRNSIVFFSTPVMVSERIPAGKRFRLGGLVEKGSLLHGDNLAVSFKVGDGSATLPVSYKGILPDLLREGQGVVAEGALDASGVFRRAVLAKHCDETYMPREVTTS